MLRRIRGGERKLMWLFKIYRLGSVNIVVRGERTRRRRSRLFTVFRNVLYEGLDYYFHDFDAVVQVFDVF